MDLFDKKSAEAIGKKLIKKGETVALAESVSAGLFQFCFSTIPDAAKFFQGGITTYNIAQKFKHLQVEPLHALSVNCVSQKVANEMALNVCKLFSSNWGIGITGYATPVPESGNKTFAYFALVRNNKIMKAGKITPHKDEPTEIQRQYVNAILRKLSSLI